MDQDCIFMQQAVLEMASIGIRSVLCLIAIYGLKAIKPKQHTILRKLTQIWSWCASAAVKDFSGMLCETD